MRNPGFNFYINFFYRNNLKQGEATLSPKHRPNKYVLICLTCDIGSQLWLFF